MSVLCRTTAEGGHLWSVDHPWGPLPCMVGRIIILAFSANLYIVKIHDTNAQYL